MTPVRWRRGEAEVERLLADGRLQRVTGAAADGAEWIATARQTLESAEARADADARTALTNAYDAARFACAGLLAQQGLRATQAGGHLVLQEVVTAQFGSAFAAFGVLRRRRNELEYPALPGEPVWPDEVDDGITEARRLIDAAERLLPELGLF